MMLCSCINRELKYLISFFFFFQAEDGIRDYKVTGVQTCALPISILSDKDLDPPEVRRSLRARLQRCQVHLLGRLGRRERRDRKSTRLNSSHLVISYAVFCLKKKKHTHTNLGLSQCHIFQDGPS